MTGNGTRVRVYRRFIGTRVRSSITTLPKQQHRLKGSSISHFSRKNRQEVQMLSVSRVTRNCHKLKMRSFTNNKVAYKLTFLHFFSLVTYMRDINLGRNVNRQSSYIHNYAWLTTCRQSTELSMNTILVRSRHPIMFCGRIIIIVFTYVVQQDVKGIVKEI